MDVKVRVVKGMQFTTIENDVGLKVMLCNLGASIFSIEYDGKPMTSHPVLAEDFKRVDLYHGKTIGQVTNRIREGKVVIGEETYQFDLNEAPNTLHGGMKGLSNQIFGNQRMKLPNGDRVVIYSFKKKHKKGTLPGNVNYMVMYVIKKDEPVIHVEYRVHTDKDTMVALTNHSFFCLGESNVYGLSLQIPSTKYIEPNPLDLIPEKLCNITPVMDFNKMKKIGKDITDQYLNDSKTKGYDHCYLLKEKGLPVILESFNYRLEVISDFEGVQIYTDNYENDCKMSNTLEKFRRSIAIEPQDSTLDRKVLTKEEGFYNRFIEYKFSKSR